MKINHGRLEFETFISPAQALLAYERSLDLLTLGLDGYHNRATNNIEDLEEGRVVYIYTQDSPSFIVQAPEEQTAMGVYSLTYIGSVNRALCFTAGTRRAKLARKIETDIEFNPTTKETIDTLCLWYLEQGELMDFVAKSLLRILGETLQRHDQSRICTSHKPNVIPNTFPAMHTEWPLTNDSSCIF